MNSRFLQEAIELAEKKMSANEGGPFGAVIARDGEVVARGWNRVTSSIDPTAHAEVEAIREACQFLGTFSLKGCEIYTSCEPCPMCLAAIYWARLDAVYYAAGREDAAEAGFDDEAIYGELSRPFIEQSLTGGQYLRDEARAVFEKWMKKEDKTPY